ncbi:MAG: hypothetical protein CME67_01140 [Halobacteriovoraceae bacterium]|nr:hypothetical protein [Halobacteriovoraceae bacterium]
MESWQEEKFSLFFIKNTQRVYFYADKEYKHFHWDLKVKVKLLTVSKVARRFWDLADYKEVFYVCRRLGWDLELEQM